MNLIDLLELAVKESRHEDLSEKKLVLAKAKSMIAGFNNEINTLEFIKKTRGDIMLKQKQTIADLNEENNDLVIEMAKMKNDHDKRTNGHLAKIKSLEKAVKGAEFKTF